MVIDTTAPEGNIFAALGIAARFMKQAHRDKADIDALRTKVMQAKSYQAACEAITDATFGSIAFYTPGEDE